LAQKLTDAEAGLKVNELITVALLGEKKKEDSRFSHYIKSLPANADHIPSHFDENAINRLGHSHVVPAIMKARVERKERYDKACEKVPELAEIPYEEYNE